MVWLFTEWDHGNELSRTYTQVKSYDCAGILDDMLAASFAVWQSKSILGRSSEAPAPIHRKRDLLLTYHLSLITTPPAALVIEQPFLAP